MMRVFKALLAALVLPCGLLLCSGCGYRRAVAAEHYLQRGVEALQAGDQAAASQYFQKAQAERSSPDLLARIGLAYADVRKCADAVPLLVESLRKMPRQPGLVRFSLFECYERMGESQEAEQVLLDALRVHRDDAWALNNLGYTAADGGVHLQIALRLVSRAVELEPRNGLIVDSLGWTYYRLGYLEKAREILDRASRLRPDPEILYHLGVVCGDMGDTETSVRYLRAAVKRDPAYRPARDALLRLGR